jgi:putative membrane protein
MKIFRQGLLPLLVSSGFTTVVSAHGVGETEADARVAWLSDPGLCVALILAAGIYVFGLRRLRRATNAPRKLRRAAWCYAAGWVALAVALVSPLHEWGEMLFFAHMAQHELLMLVAPPLLILGEPGLVFLWALSRSAASRVGRWSKSKPMHEIWRALTLPAVAWMIHAIALWVWHVPALFEATLKNEWVHHAQHLSFFLSALLFWQAILRGARRVFGYGAGVLYLFTTAVHSGALGALITFAGRVWYPHYLLTSAAAGFSPLEDQQLGGLIMWIPAGFVYVAAALLMFGRWLQGATDETLGNGNEKLRTSQLASN